MITVGAWRPVSSRSWDICNAISTKGFNRTCKEMGLLESFNDNKVTTFKTGKSSETNLVVLLQKH